MKNISFASIVVVYNSSCNDSITCNKLAQLKKDDTNVIIYDNSTRDFHNKEYCEKAGWIYLGGEGNKGLSKAYNCCIQYLKENNFDGYICLFDDDTDINPNYFSFLKKSISTHYQIYVPLIYSNNFLISPCILSHGHCTKTFKNEQQALNYKLNNISAINSCMVIDINLFQNYKYDENIFLDGIDHNFISDMTARGNKIKVLNYKCCHSFSGTETPVFESALVRFKIFKNDYKYIFRNNKTEYLKLVGKRALKLCFKYKTLRFLSLKGD